MYKLVIEDDEGKTKIVPFIRDEMTIGRKEGNTIRLTERNVSRRHAKLLKNSGDIEVEDYSRYGTKRNGEKIAGGRAPFREGDVILIGDYRLSLKVAQGVTTPESAGPRPAGTIDPSKAAKLVVISSNFAGREFPLIKAEMVIGRTEGDIRIDHRSISRNHAKLVRDGDRYKILDLKSANGVKVNGEAYRSVQLRRGDVIELGHVRMKFAMPGDPPVVIPTGADLDDENLVPPGSGMGKFLAIGGVLALLLAVVVVAVIAFGPPDDNGKATTTANNSTTSKTDSETSEAIPTETDSPDTSDKPSPELLALIEKSKKKIENREWDSAIALLDEATEQAPDAEKSNLHKLRGKANKEKSFQAHYDAGKKSLAAKKFEEAIDELRNIPEDTNLTIYAKLVQDEKLIEKAREGLRDKLGDYISEARSHFGRGNFKSSLASARRALDVDPENEEALQLKRQSERKLREEKQPDTALAKKAERDKAAAEKAKAEREKAAAARPDKKINAADKKEKRDALLSEARKSSATGNQDQAIAKARESLSYGGGGAANRILAIAYEKKGDSTNAIKYYNIILKGYCRSANTKLADVIRKKIAGLGGQPGC